MNKPFYIIGAGGHAKVIIEIIEEMGEKVLAVNDNDPKREILLGYPVSNQLPTPDSVAVIGIGNNRIRKKIALEINVPFKKAIHPKANLSSRCVIGDGTVVMAGATINSETVIGKHCIINTNASVDHDCVLADFVHVSPGSSIAGGVTIGEGSHIGIGSSIIPGIKIGQWVTIGAGAAIVEDVPDHAVVVGVPGKIIKYNKD